LSHGTADNNLNGYLSVHTYYLYGLCLTSPWPLPCPDRVGSGFAESELFQGSLALFTEATQKATIPPKVTDWFHYAPLEDGSDYLRWTGLFEFLISADGRRIAARTLTDISQEAFQTYLLGQVLSFALLKQGIESLHSTVVAVDGGAVAILGDCGYGKSSLAAAFLHAGYPLLTDDVLVVKEEGDSFFAYPGLPRIKLFPEVADLFLREQARGTPMNPDTTKLIIPLCPPLSWQTTAPLRAIYALRAPNAKPQTKRITIRALSQRKSLLKLISSTFNTQIRTPDRLTRQFALAARLSDHIPVKSLSYPRDLSQLPAVVDAIRSDLTEHPSRPSSISNRPAA